MHAEQLPSASTCVQIYNCKSLKIVIIAVKKIKQDITRENNSVGWAMGIYFKVGDQGKLVGR